MKQGEDVQTAQALIEAARKLFARHGYEGTSVRAITAAAGANLGAITYHFGSKRELYDHVVESVVTPLAVRVEEIVAQNASAPARATGVVEAYFRYFAANPDLPQLMMQELVLAGVPPEVIAVPMKRVHGALTKLVEEGQLRGEIRAGPAPLMSVFILSVPVHLAILQRALGAHVGVDIRDPHTRAQLVAAAVAFVHHGLSVEA